jgi:ribose transport system substrate-binding protein
MVSGNAIRQRTSTRRIEMKKWKPRGFMLVALLGASAFASLGAACGGDDSSSSSSAAGAASAQASSVAAEVSSAVDSAASQADSVASEATAAVDSATSAATDTAAATDSAAASDTAAGADTSARPDGVVDFQDAQPGSGDGLKLGYISLGDSVPFVKLVSDSIKAEAQKAGAELVFCDSQLDGQKALDCAKSFKTQGVQAYLNFQVDQKLAPAICAAGPDVPVIAIDIVQDPCQVSFMGAANEYAGNIAGEAIGKYAKDTWNCEYDAYVSLESTAAADANRLRMGGTRDGFKKYCEIKNEKVLDADRTDPARTKFADVLTTLPGKKRIVVVAINDDGLIGALAAARTANRVGDIFMAGQGADPTSHCEILKNPNWVADAAYFPERYGQIAIPYLIKAAKGETIPEKILVPHVAITKDNIGEFYADSIAKC